MNKNIAIYKNELKNSMIPKYKFIGIVSELIMNKEIYRKNTDVEYFLISVFDLEFKAYIFCSRTLILARTIRYISISDDKKINEYRKKMYDYLKQQLTKEDNKKNMFDGWLK